jgi:hypothetical protein
MNNEQSKSNAPQNRPQQIGGMMGRGGMVVGGEKAKNFKARIRLSMAMSHNKPMTN